MPYQLRVLGPPELVSDEGRPVSLSMGKPLAVLVYVACSPGPVPRDDLAIALWPGSTRDKGRHSVRQALWVLRNAIGEDLFESDDPLSLRDGAVETDLQVFAQALSEGDMEKAQVLWRGPVLDHFVLAGVSQWSHWKEDLRNDLELRFRMALMQRAAVLRDDGDPEKTLSTLEKAIEVTPAAEAPHLARIELLLDLLRLDAAREALADAHRALGGGDLTTARSLSALEERLNKTILEQQSRVQEQESFPLEFVGRSRELALLQRMWRDARAGRTQTAVITGPSGIGKTRMAQELLAGLEGEDVRTVSLKSTRAERKLRWGAAADFVRQLLRLPGSAGISSGSDSLLKAMLPSLGRDTINLQTVNGVSPVAILDAATDLLAAVTFEAPLVVLLDDFQWIDAESRTLFNGLTHRVRDLTVLFLVLGRSDLSSRNWEEMETTLVEEAGAQHLSLAHLIKEEVGELLALGAAFPNPEDADRVVTGIHRASGGNPLFVREILRELSDQGVLLREEHGWVFHTASLPKTFSLPENIRALLAERLGRLTPPAATLAATLAMEGRRRPSDVLRTRSQLPNGTFTQAVAELLDRGVVEWVEGTSLDFVHDQLRDAARDHLAEALPDPPDRASWLVRNRGLMAVAAILFFAIPMAVLWGRGDLVGAGRPDPDPLPYGGGDLVMRMADGSLTRLPVASGPPSQWEVGPFETPPPPGAEQVFRGPQGEFFWFGRRNTQEGPDIQRILDDGSRIPLFAGPGDQGLQDMSPDRSRLLFTSEDPEAEPFGHILFWADTAGIEKHLVFRGGVALGSAAWSPGGDLVAFAITASPDTVAVHALTGERIGTLPVDEFADLDWCGPSTILVLARSRQEDNLVRVNVQDMSVDTLATGFFGPRFTCSPDGTAVVHLTAVEGRSELVLRDLENGQVYPLPQGLVDRPDPEWLDPPLPPVPVAVKASSTDSTLEWSETIPLEAEVILSDGSTSDQGLWWESLDPEVAAVNPSHALTGNRAGSTLVLARWGHSLIDTLPVQVVDRGSPGRAFLREEFGTIDLNRWAEMGRPRPLAITLDGEPVLEIRGDEKYSDGLLFRNPIPLDRGVTVEIEFKFHLDAPVWQSIRLCLIDGDPRQANLEEGTLMAGKQEACVSYPAREFEKMDPAEAAISVAPMGDVRARIPGELPPEEWTHLALQVRPDGQVSMVVNRVPVAVHPVNLHTQPHQQWTLALHGDAVGTRIFVRNLNIWTEVRYAK